MRSASSSPDRSRATSTSKRSRSRSTPESAIFSETRTRQGSVSTAGGYRRRPRAVVPEQVVRCAEEPLRRARFRDLQLPADQRQLLRARERLDPRLLAAGRRAVGVLRAPGQRHGEPAARVAARAAGVVGGEPALDVHGPAAVQRAVGAAQQVDPGHDGRIAYAAAVARTRVSDADVSAFLERLEESVLRELVRDSYAARPGG